MAIAEAKGIWKRFDKTDVVQDVTFAVEPGVVLGIVGPNGAGKTTTIRMLLDIIRPDRGSVLVFGKPFSGEHRDMIGYLPEERGLYRDLRVAETLTYLGTLKGLARAEAGLRAIEVVDRVGMSEHRDKKVKELSRGMAQLIQVGATIIHRPRLLILDEPFAGLDPVNLRLVKEILAEARGEGAAIMLSTHQMNQVEELCDEVLMINHGRVVLFGPLDEVLRSAGRESILVECDRLPDELPGVVKTTNHGRHFELVLDGDSTGQAVLEALVEQGAGVRRFEMTAPPLEEIFIQKARQMDA